jgi:hypothetical protein
MTPLTAATISAFVKPSISTSNLSRDYAEPPCRRAMRELSPKCERPELRRE